MSTPPRVRPFPAHRLARVGRADRALARLAKNPAWLPRVDAVASALARQLGLGGAGIRFERGQVIHAEELRAVFPGSWRFAVFCQPLRDRTGFLALDPLLTGRALARMHPGRTVLPAWGRTRNGEDGTIAWILGSALARLAGDGENGSWSGWRYCGMLDSAGAVGRLCTADQLLVASWLQVRAGWDRGFAAWLEPESSLRRRDATATGGGNEPAWRRPTLVGLEISFAAVLGRSTLATAELVGLRPGDVVLYTRCAPADGVRLERGPIRIEARKHAGELRVEDVRYEPGGGVMQPAEMMTEQTPSGAVVSGDEAGVVQVGMGELPVPITVEAGRVEMTIAQLADLKAGDVLACPDAVLGPVALRTGGRLVAYGELVEVEGRRGVRVLEVALDRGADDEDLA